MRDLKNDELSYVYGAGVQAKPQPRNKFHKTSSKKRNKTSDKKRRKTSHNKASKKKAY